MSCIAVPTPFGERFMLSKARGLFKHTPQCKCKDNKNSAIYFLFEEKNRLVGENIVYNIK